MADFAERLERFIRLAIDMGAEIRRTSTLEELESVSSWVLQWIDRLEETKGRDRADLILAEGTQWIEARRLLRTRGDAR